MGHAAHKARCGLVRTSVAGHRCPWPYSRWLRRWLWGRPQRWRRTPSGLPTKKGPRCRAPCRNPPPGGCPCGVGRAGGAHIARSIGRVLYRVFSSAETLSGNGSVGWQSLQVACWLAVSGSGPGTIFLPASAGILTLSGYFGARSYRLVGRTPCTRNGCGASRNNSDKKNRGILPLGDREH